MKRGIAILLAALLLGLCACSPTGADASEPGGTQPVTQPATQPATRGTEPETTSEPPTQQSATDATAQTPEEPEINEAFTAAAPDAPDGALGVMFNEPFDGLDLTATQLGPAGEYDRAYIVAKYVGSWVNVFSVTWESGRLNVGDKALYSFRTGQGDVISGSFDRPDGGAMYYLDRDGAGRHRFRGVPDLQRPLGLAAEGISHGHLLECGGGPARGCRCGRGLGAL